MRVRSTSRTRRSRTQPAAAALDAALRARGAATQVLAGADALVQIAALPEVDHVMAAIVGAAGLPSTLAAARAGKRLLLANKESLVMAGAAAHADRCATRGATLLPIDSEHNAIFQCLPRDARCGEAPRGVKRILLTASGGPFLDSDRSRLERRHARRGLRAPELGDGPQDLGRFGDADEQGPRADRGLPAVRRRAARRSRSSSIRRASCIRWSSTSTARCWRS